MPDLTALSDKELLEHKYAAHADKKAAELALKKIHDTFISRHNAAIQALYKEKGEPYGRIHLILGEMDIEIDTKKKVTWDQEKLAAIAAQIVADGGNLSDYIDIEYTIQEKKWYAWGDNIRGYFADARTVKPQNPSIELKYGGEE
jgi:hypothetical protein